MQQSEKFLRAVQEFKKALPSLRQDITTNFKMQAQENTMFSQTFAFCFEALVNHFQREYQQQDHFNIFEHLSDLEPDFTKEHLSTFLIQYFMLRPVLGWIFPDVLAHNHIAQQMEKILHVLEDQGWLRLSVDSYYAPFEHELQIASSWDEKQHIFNTICEHFINGFDPQKAEELSVIYTPPEVVDFMCASCEEQVQQTYGRSLSSTWVPIVDPCTGTGTFLVNIIRRIQLDALPYKYKHELFGIEIMLLPYVLALLNIEQAFWERTEYYLPFPGMRYADALRF